jgi:hypothetical protein
MIKRVVHKYTSFYLCIINETLIKKAFEHRHIGHKSGESYGKHSIYFSNKLKHSYSIRIHILQCYQEHNLVSTHFL